MIGFEGSGPRAWRGAIGPLLLAAVLGPLAQASPAETGKPVPAVVRPSDRGQGRADRVVVYKADRSLLLMRGTRVLRAYQVALGFAPDGPKRAHRDGRTPEGEYILDWRTDRSQFYRAIHISYPNSADRQRAAALGRPPGGGIMIHGLPNRMATLEQRSHASGDWTNGCIAVTNREMDEIWDLVSDGTPIEIRP